MDINLKNVTVYVFLANLISFFSKNILVHQHSGASGAADG
jgi:hypothetical protein